MTDKRCVRTGKKSELMADIYMPEGHVMWNDYGEELIRYYCHPADYDKMVDELLRDATKLERLLEMTDNE